MADLQQQQNDSHGLCQRLKRFVKQMKRFLMTLSDKLMLCNMHLSSLNRNRKRGCINLIVIYEMNSELRYDISLQEIFKVFTFKLLK